MARRKSLTSRERARAPRRSAGLEFREPRVGKKRPPYSMPAGARKARRPSTSPTSPRTLRCRARRRRRAACCRSRRAPCSSRCHRHTSRKTCTSCSGGEPPAERQEGEPEQQGCGACVARAVGHRPPFSGHRHEGAPVTRVAERHHEEAPSLPSRAPPSSLATIIGVCTRSRTRAMPSASATTVAGMCVWPSHRLVQGGAPHRMPERGSGVSAAAGPEPAGRADAAAPGPRDEFDGAIEAGGHTAARVGHAGDACPEGSPEALTSLFTLPLLARFARTRNGGVRGVRGRFFRLVGLSPRSAYSANSVTPCHRRRRPDEAATSSATSTSAAGSGTPFSGGASSLTGMPCVLRGGGSASWGDRRASWPFHWRRCCARSRRAGSS